MEARNYPHLLWVQTTISDHSLPLLLPLSFLQDHEPRATSKTSSLPLDRRPRNPLSLLRSDNFNLSRTAIQKGPSLRGSFFETQRFFATSGAN